MRNVVNPTPVLALVLAPVLVLLLASGAVRAGDDWRRDWRVAEGFAIDVDAAGFTHPTAIAFVRAPGPAPSDALYFVTELEGRVAVVTRDRSVHTFAREDLALHLAEPLPSSRGEGGMAGIVLDDARGFVFVSMLIEDAAGILRNRIVRYTSTPHTFGLTSHERKVIDAPFADHVSAVSHQVGPMVLDHEGLLYVGVGDGKVAQNARALASTNGKILRMTIDGEPAPKNPYGERAPFLYAIGLRNPFSLAFAGDVLFAGDNGPAIDRFVRIEAGRDYLSDGTDWSIGTSAELVVAPAVSPVQTQFLAPENEVFPALFRSRLFVAFAGNPERRTALGERGVATIRVENQRLASAPQMFLQYIGERIQTPVGLAFGPDGLYVVALFPTHADGSTGILRVSHDPSRAHPHVIAHGEDVPAFMKHKGCFSCHTRLASDDVPAGPPLNRESLSRYDVDRLAKLLRDPRSVDRAATMPALGLSEWEAQRIATYLLSSENRIEPDKLTPDPWYRIPVNRIRIKYALIGAAVGALVSAALFRRRGRAL